MKRIQILPSLLLFVSSFSIYAENETPAFNNASESVRKQLTESMKELDELRKKIAEDTIPLSRKLNELENELSSVRLEYQQTTRLLDSRTLDLTNLNSEIKSRKDEKNYLSNLLGEYVRNFESRLHIAEIQRYESQLEAARLAPENSNLSDMEIYDIQTSLVYASLGRLRDALGGSRFQGTAVDAEGIVKNGTFVLLGPTAIFVSDDGTAIGTAEQRLGSLEPTVIGFSQPMVAAAAKEVTTEGKGKFPFDPTLGTAHKIEDTKETLPEHIQKGGPVMIPILGMAAAALLVALVKWISMLFLRNPSRKTTKELFEAVTRKDKDEAVDIAAKVGGPTGQMLAIGAEHIEEPRELIEEVMYEKVLTTRLKLNSWLPFISICAASAPLMGLLGTVSGIINTFKLITIFGSGDAKTLSGGISEALITTKFGLIVAIPALLLHAYLSRRARCMTDEMEKSAVAFVNHVSKSNYSKNNDIQEIVSE